MLHLNISSTQVQLLIVIFIRISAILFAAPIFGGKNVPVLAKVGIAFALSLVLHPLVSQKINPITNGIIFLGIGIISEVILGSIIGFAIRLVFAGIQLAGQLVGFQMGMSIANVLDPMSSNQVSIMSQLNYMFAFLIFLVLDAHHWLIRALVESFTLVPPFEFVFSQVLAEKIILLANNMFVISIKIGAPIIAILLLTSAAFGLVARAVPQMHIFIVSMPLQIMIGLLATAWIFPYFMSYLVMIFENLGRDILILLRIMG